MVVAETDAAVLGVYCGDRAQPERGVFGYCVALLAETVSVAVVRDPVTALQQALPFLHVGSWPEGLAAEAVTHASAVTASSGLCMTGLAMVGDSAMRTLAFQRMREAQLPTAMWQSCIQADQGNAAFVKAAGENNLRSLVIVGGGTTLVPTSKVYADLVEAVAGAVAEAEPYSVFETYCKLVGAVRATYEAQ
jgi:hypothetical protein